MDNGNVRVLIPAAGKGVRSGLSYPKCLYRIKGEPIIIRLCRKMLPYDKHPIIVINPKDKGIFDAVMDEFKISPIYCFQQEANGMGAAILSAEEMLNESDTILLTWSDIPFLSSQTILSLYNCHTQMENDFSFVSSIGDNCYTIVERTGGKISSLKETKALGIPPLPYGERDIGLFVFKKKPVFELLRKGKDGNYINGLREHGFLSVVEDLVKEHYKVEAFPIALPSDLLSFNSPEDLLLIERKAESG